LVYYVLIIILVAFIFDFINGFHDSANSIATIVGTRVLSPLAAVVWAASFNFMALFVVKTAVAKSIQTGLVDSLAVTPNVIFAGLLGAIAWNLITWYYGIPSSSSHALIGGYAGAAITGSGWSAILWGKKWIQTLSFIAISPLVGLFAGFTLIIMIYWIFHRVRPNRVDKTFRVAQLLSSALLSLAHGGNDAQKTMGIVVALLVSVNTLFANETGFLRHFYVTADAGIPLWVELLAYSMLALGTLFGGWRIVATMGSRITKLRPVGGFAAETGGAVAILLATKFGIPVSTTHTITGSIVGVGASNRLSAVRWGLAGRIVWAWILTIPASAVMAAISYWIINALHPM
jgi:PiT family inorganic phosphate transporter